MTSRSEWRLWAPSSVARIACHMCLAAALARTVSSLAAQGPDATPVRVVAGLYHDFAWEAVIDEPNDFPALTQLPRPAFERYLTPDLARLILNDEACMARTHEICKLDFNPVWASQDPGGVSELKVSASAERDAVLVTMRYPDGSVTSLTYRMQLVRGNWRIADILFQSGPNSGLSLAGILR